MPYLPTARARLREAAEQRQDQSFGERLCDQSSATHAEREPERGLATTTQRAREEQIGHVRAGNEQYDDGDAGHPDERPRLEARIRDRLRS